MSDPTPQDTPRMHRAAQESIARVFETGCQLESEVRDLTRWKAEQMEAERQWDPQSVGRLLGVPLGEEIWPAIEPGILKLQRDLTEARRLVCSLGEFVKWYRDQFGGQVPEWGCECGDCEILLWADSLLGEVQK